MGKRKIIDGTEIQEGSGNVYRDLGYPDADDMLVKAQPVAKISEIIRSQELTQVETSRILCVTQPKLSSLLRGRFRGLSKHRLSECLTNLGRNVQIQTAS